MSEKKNIVASVLAKLRNTSKSSDVPFQQVLQQYSIERFLYRISKSKHAESVILKGAVQPEPRLRGDRLERIVGYVPGSSFS